MIEYVRGTVIGPFTYPYEFWTRDGKHKIAHGFFENDDQAEEWFKSKYTSEYLEGVEMRKFE